MIMNSDSRFVTKNEDGSMIIDFRNNERTLRNAQRLKQVMNILIVILFFSI